MSQLYFLFFISLAILLEGTVTSIPIVLDVLLVFYILKRTSRIFIPAFISGIILDVFGVRTLGITSIFFIVFLFIVLQYARKFEISTYPFVFFASFAGGLTYLTIFRYHHILEQAIVSSLISVLLFKGLRKLKVQS